MINANRCPQSAKQDIVLKHVLNTLYYTVEFCLFVIFFFFLLKLSIISAATAEVDKEK